MTDESEDIDLEGVPDDDLIEEVAFRYCDPVPEEGTLDAELDELLKSGRDIQEVCLELEAKRQSACNAVLQLIENEHAVRIAHAVAIHEAALARLDDSDGE